MTCLSNRHAWERRAQRNTAFRLLPGAPCPRLLAYAVQPRQPPAAPAPANADRPPKIRVRAAA